MPVPFLDAMAQAIYFYEGHQPQDVNHLNNNPGNLRAGDSWKGEKDSRNYRIYPDFISGYTDLRNDIRAKITGHNEHGLSSDSSLNTFFSVYAPAGDHNVPWHYAQFVCMWLGKTYSEGFDVDEPISMMLEKIGQTVV